MLRILILQNLYHLSDQQMEGMLYDRLSFRRFCGFKLEDKLPDTTTILRFRHLLEGHSDKLLQLVNQELIEKRITFSGGAIIDATVIEPAYLPPSGGQQSSTDPEAGWAKKQGNYIYGYKAHTSTTPEGPT